MKSTTQSKAELRRAVRATLAQWSQEKRMESDAKLVQAFLSHPWVAEAQQILVYWGVGTEVDTRPIIEGLLSQGKTLCLPKCLPQRAMVARQVTGLDGLDTGAYGIPEPGENCPTVEKDKLDLILVPGLAFDAQGYRLGQGGGYYDRYLADFSGRTLALARGVVAQETVPREDFDRPVDWVLWDK